MSQPAAALYIQPPILETIVATQRIANIRYLNGSSGDAPVERFSAATTQALLDASRGDLYWRAVLDGLLFLETAEFITGEILHVNGGQSLGH